MSNITDILFSAQDGKLVENLAERFGLSGEQIKSVVEALIPALSMGLTNAAGEAESLEKIIGAVTTPQHHGAFDNPDLAHSQESVDKGQELVAHLFGSSAAAGQIAQVAARASGVRPDIISQLLPILASVVLGGLFKSFNSQGLGGILGQLTSSGALGQILGQVLGGGSPAGGGQQPSPMPTPMPQGGAAAGGGLGGLLGGLLGALFGGGGRRAPGGMPGNVDAGPSSGPAGLPPGLDAQSLQAALEQIKKTLQPGAAGANAGHQAELQDILGQVFGQRGR